MACANLIDYTEDGEHAALQERVRMCIETGLAGGANVETKKMYARMIHCAPEYARYSLFLCAKNALNNALVEPPLYGAAVNSSRTIERKNFVKTGSGLTTLHGVLRGKTVIRRITPAAFDAWKMVYENYALWKKEKFDYVPIEPIQSYHLRGECVDVSSGVLDCSLAMWREMGGYDLPYLERMTHIIISFVENFGVSHGRPLDDNFCLRFFRDAQGNFDFAKTPRIYLIDFDAAERMFF